MKHTSWLWPDRIIRKRESRRLREEHNALYNSHAELLDALEAVMNSTTEVEKLRVISGRSGLTTIGGIANAAIAKAKG